MKKIEGRFSLQAKITTLITVLTGFYMLWYLGAWDRYFQIQFWWVHAMTLVWILFSLVVYILEPLLLHRIFREYAMKNPGRTFDIVQKLHWFLLALSLQATAGTVAGAHGWFWI